MTTPVIRRRKRPIEVDTIQWTGHNEADVQAFTGGPAVFYALDAEDREGSDDPEATATVFDKLHCTWILVYTGQHIVRGVKGEHHPIAEDVLAETYEAVSSAVAQSAEQPAEPVCKFDEGCHRVVACDPGCAVAAAELYRRMAGPGQTALRDRIAEALYAHDHPGHLVPLNETGMEPAYRESADAVMAVLRGLTLRELEQLHRPNTPPSRPEPHRMAAVELLRRTESYLSALHGSVARHDNLAANLGCAGCELRDQVNAELRRMAVEAQQPTGAEGPRTVCVCGHTKGEHITVSGRLLCDECDGLRPDACKEFEAL